MTEAAPENHAAYDDPFGLEVDEQFIGRELSPEEVEELLND